MKPLSESIASLLLILAGEGEAKTKSIDQRVVDAKAELIAIQTQVEREHATATRERDEARTNAANLQTQFDSATQAATTAQGELATARTTISTLTSERDQSRATIVTKDARIKNLEALCNIKGINPDAAPPVVDDPGAEPTYAQLEAKYNEAKTPAAKREVLLQMESLAAKKKAGK